MSDDRLIRQYKAEVCKLFRRFGKNVEVYLRASKVKGENYDPIRDEGYTVVNRNPYQIKAWVRQPSPKGKLLEQIGTVDTEVKELIVFEKNLTTLEIAEKIVVDGKNYHVLNDASGNRMTVLERIYDLARILIWLKEGD